MSYRRVWIIPVLLALALVALIAVQHQKVSGTAEAEYKWGVEMHLAGWTAHEGQFQLIGFLTYVAGLPERLFCPCPSDNMFHIPLEKCAYFTFTVERLETQFAWFFVHPYHPMPIIQDRALIHIYYDEEMPAERSICDPNTFATVVHIATFKTQPGQFLAFGARAFDPSGNEFQTDIGRLMMPAFLMTKAEKDGDGDLLPKDFTFQGTKYNFKNLIIRPLMFSLYSRGEKYKCPNENGTETNFYGGSAWFIY